jgi:hypothetical protein
MRHFVGGFGVDFNLSLFFNLSAIPRQEAKNARVVS